MYRSALALAALIACLTLGSCLGAQESPSDPSVSPSPVDSSPALALYPTRLTPGGLLIGQLRRHGGCLFVQDRDGTMYGVAWPAETTHWESSTMEIVVGESRAAIGDSVSVGGGPYEIDRENIDDPRWDWVTPPRPECLGDQFFFAYTIEREG
jgi:hypothetical protein